MVDGRRHARHGGKSRTARARRDLEADLEDDDRHQVFFAASLRLAREDLCYGGLEPIKSIFPEVEGTDSHDP